MVRTTNRSTEVGGYVCHTGWTFGGESTRDMVVGGNARAHVHKRIQIREKTDSEIHAACTLQKRYSSIMRRGPAI